MSAGPLRWRRKWEHDAATDSWSPIPLQVVSNEEYAPVPQTRAQAEVAHRLRESAERQARRLGMSRRRFLGTTCGMAAAFLAMNRVYGDLFDVDPVEAAEPAATAERRPPGPFVFDVQTHHVAAPRQHPNVLRLRQEAERLRVGIRNRGTMDDVYLENYIKEVFLDSDTAVAVISGVPSQMEPLNILPPHKMVETREIVNRLAASRRVVSHGLISPTKGTQDLEDMQKQAEELKVEAWKGYPGQLLGRPPRSWVLDDEKVSYPMLEAARRLRVKNVCIHQGFPFAGAEREPGWHPRGVETAARAFPDLNFIIYHSALRAIPGTGSSGRVDWVSDLCDIVERDPTLTNVYAELGSTFGLLAVANPAACAHVLGLLQKAFGDERIVWGTDSIWWGSPQWQIEAFRRLRAPLTPEAKTKILGLNAARLFGVDPAAVLNQVPKDFVGRMKAAYLEEGARPSLTQYGWVLAR